MTQESKILKRAQVSDYNAGVEWLITVARWRDENVRVSFDVLDPSHPCYGEDGPRLMASDLQTILSEIKEKL